MSLADDEQPLKAIAMHYGFFRDELRQAAAITPDRDVTLRELAANWDEIVIIFGAQKTSAPGWATIIDD